MDVVGANERKLIVEGLELAKQLRIEIARAKRAGIDTTEMESRLTEIEQQLQRLRRVYISRT